MRKKIKMRKITLLQLVLFFTINAFSQVNIDSGLVAYYSFADTVNDESIFNNHGIVHGAIKTDGYDGVPNSAYYFDGVDDYIEINADSNLAASTYQLSISVWVKISVFDLSDNKEAYILEKMDGSGSSSNWGVKYFDKDGNPTVEELRFCGPLFTPSSTGGGTNTIVGYWSSTVPALDTWYHIVVNHDSGNDEIFINGVSESFVGNGGNASSFWKNTGDLIIGKATDNSSYFNGAIDEVRIYNRILSNDDVTFLYDGTLPTSINNTEENFDINIYPTPTDDYVFISNSLSTNETILYSVFDISGNKVSSGVLNNNRIDIQDLNKGLYILTLNNQRWNKSIKIVKN